MLLPLETDLDYFLTIYIGTGRLVSLSLVCDALASKGIVYLLSSCYSEAVAMLKNFARTGPGYAEFSGVLFELVLDARI